MKPDLKKEKLQRKVYNNGFYDYYYKCQDCGCESISLKHLGGFQHADLICNKCGTGVINNKIQIEDTFNREIIEPAVGKMSITYTEDDVLDLLYDLHQDIANKKVHNRVDKWFEQRKKK